ncbi:MAG: pyrroline-5-carboxylate reductase [Gammaproteobacteria bacterium]
MEDTRIAVIGCGNMGYSLIGGLIANGHPRQCLYGIDIDSEARDRLARQFDIAVFATGSESINQADVIVLAVKPQTMQSAANSLSDILGGRNCLIVSIAAGIRLSVLAAWLGEGAAIVRVMPNTPALIQAGASALYANTNVTPAQRNTAEAIMRSVGLAIWLDDETMMDAVTALSGSGPAYFFLVMEVMEKAALSLGMTQQQARLLTLETAFGAAKMALHSSCDAATLRSQVTSPGGTTERALNVLLEGNIETLFKSALEAARDRSAELAETLGGS